MPSTGSTPPGQGSIRLPRDQRRAQIIAAAATAFLRGGFEVTSMEDVAEQAGISRLLVYRFFESKRDLYRAVLASVTDEFVSEFRARELAEIRQRGGIVWMALRIARRHPDALRLLWRHAAHEPASVRFAQRFRKVLADYAEAMIAIDGRITEPRIVRWCATALAAHLLDGLCAWLDDGDASLDAEYAVLQTCSLFAMVGAWGDPHPPDWMPAARR
jgi:AcrR family transcriptional regulator